jgi:glycine/D-amino acid oxidase-like deaminating enzyme
MRIPMQFYEVIIIGSGITGASLAYELVKLGVSVLLVEQDKNPPSATRYSYGGISYWAGVTDLTRSLAAESLEIHRENVTALDLPTEFRELPLIGTINHSQDPIAVLQTYDHFTKQPQLLTPAEAVDLEPLLNPNAIAAALLMPYAQINAIATAHSYAQTMVRLGGHIAYDRVLTISSESDGVRVHGKLETYHGDRVILCTGGVTRALLQDSGLPIHQYFSHAESIETDPCDLQMRSVVMPAEIRRFELERSAAIDDGPWEAGLTGHNQDLIPPVLDAGALQFADGSLRFGQISRTQTSLAPQSSPEASEQWIRSELAKILPKVAQVPGRWVRCTVAFSADHLPLVGPVGDDRRIQVFSGFSNPMALVPATAKRFAHQLASDKNLIASEDDKGLQTLLPSRFGMS